jgi:hypothetical protein
MIRAAATPPPLSASKFAYGRKAPAMRAAELPDICSVNVQDLFSDIPDPIHRAGEDTAPVRDAARSALAGVDMSMIQPDDSVNILCSEHGFSMMGGDAYAALIKTVRDEVVERTGATKVKLAMSSAASKFESAEIIPRHGLDEHFEGKTFNFGPYDPGIAIDTEIGRLYGIRKAYAAKWLIHVHYDDPREIHYHHVNGRLLKSFTMSYARMETRSIFHQNFPTRSANIVPRAIYESPYIQQRWGFSAALSTSPSGTMGVDADNDLIALDRRLGALILSRYGKMVQLFSAIDSCFVVADDTRWLPYQHAGGLTACSLYENGEDHFDLDLPTHPPAHPDKGMFKAHIKGVVMNYAWKLASTADLTVAADANVGKDLLRIHPDKDIVVANNLAEAVQIVTDRSGTDKGIVFDGCYGAINMTRPMAEFLIAKAPEVARRVDEVLLPKWLRQRGLPVPVAA